jgi:glucose-1-phosphatase
MAEVNRTGVPKRILLCDLGGVVVDFSFSLALDSWAAASGSDGLALRDRFTMDRQFEAFEAGRLSTGGYFDHLRMQLGISLTDADMAAGWNSIYLGVNRHVLELLHELRSNGVRLVGVTNTNPVHLSHWLPWYQREFPVFDTLFISTEMGCRKPEPAFFAAVEAAEGFEEGDLVVFVDDAQENVEGGSRVGIDGFVFHDAVQMRMELRERGLLP